MHMPLNRRLFLGLFASLALALSGCTSFKHLPPEQFRSAEFYRDTRTIHKSIPQIKESIMLNKPSSWGPDSRVRIKMGPDDTSLTVWWQMFNLYDYGTMALLDCEVDPSNPGWTKATIYAANSFWERAPRNVLELAE